MEEKKKEKCCEKCTHCWIPDCLCHSEKKEPKTPETGLIEKEQSTGGEKKEEVGMLQSYKQEREKMFDEKFHIPNCIQPGYGEDKGNNFQIKSFLSTSIDGALALVVGEIEKMESKPDGGKETYALASWRKGYNRALSDLLTKLKEMK